MRKFLENKITRVLDFVVLTSFSSLHSVIGQQHCIIKKMLESPEEPGFGRLKAARSFSDLPPPPCKDETSRIWTHLLKEK
jgi:hypothetical protein